MKHINWQSLIPDDAELANIFKGSWSESAGVLASMIDDMPIALWQVDARKPGAIFAALRKNEVTDIESYLQANPELIEYACDTVQINRANRAAMELLKAPDQEVLLQSVRYMFAECMDAAARVMMARFNGQSNHLDQFRMRRFDGELIDVLFLVTYPGAGIAQDNTFLIVLDVTAQKKAEAANQKLQTELAHLGRLATLGEYGATIAHEVKQPLAAISAYGGALLRRLDNDEPDLLRIGQLANKILLNANEAGEIVSRIQLMAKKANLNPVRLEVKAVFQNALALLSGELRSRKVELEVDVPSSSYLYGDHVRLSQLLINLLMNAMQALEVKTAEKKQIRLSVCNSQEQLTLTVEDNGPGIAPGLADTIFDSFVSTREEGMGMGLAICRSIISEMGGTIAADRSELGGARFTVVFPVADQA